MARILLIDADAAARERLAKHFRRHGHEVALAADAQQAFRALIEERIDVIVSELAMPDFDAVKMLHCIRTDEHTAHIPVVAVSAERDPATLAAAKRLGVGTCFPKPASGERLLDAVTKALESAAPVALRATTLGGKPAAPRGG